VLLDATLAEEQQRGNRRVALTSRRSARTSRSRALSSSIGDVDVRERPAIIGVSVRTASGESRWIASSSECLSAQTATTSNSGTAGASWTALPGTASLHSGGRTHQRTEDPKHRKTIPTQNMAVSGRETNVDMCSAFRRGFRARDASSGVQSDSKLALTLGVITQSA
jgi:hypothetical protein